MFQNQVIINFGYLINNVLTHLHPTFDIFFNCSIAVLHTLVNVSDQFIWNVFLLHGQLHQVLRDIGMILPDILHIILPIIVYRQNVRSRETIDVIHDGTTKSRIMNQDLMVSLSMVLLMWLIASHI